MNNTGNNSTPLLLAEKLAKTYPLGQGGITVLRGLDLQVPAGRTVSIRGASGAGKSTLLHVLGGLDRPTGGRVLYRGDNIYRLPAHRRADLRARRIGFVFQSYHLLPELDVLENVMLPALSRRGAARARGALRQRALSLLTQVGLAERANHLATELSGGEQQRTAVARALMNRPELILADEPTGNLDSATGRQVLDCLFTLVREAGVTLLLVSHDPAVTALSDDHYFMRDGCLASGVE